MFPIQLIIRAVWSVLDVCFHGKGSIVPGRMVSSKLVINDQLVVIIGKNCHLTCFNILAVLSQDTNTSQR